MSVIICGLIEGDEKQYRCPYCGFESDDIERFATSMCWYCVYSDDQFLALLSDEYDEEPA